jgi:hypothetical protein
MKQIRMDEDRRDNRPNPSSKQIAETEYQIILHRDRIGSPRIETRHETQENEDCCRSHAKKRVTNIEKHIHLSNMAAVCMHLLCANHS